MKVLTVPKPQNAHFPIPCDPQKFLRRTRSTSELDRKTSSKAFWDCMGHLHVRLLLPEALNHAQ